MTGFDPASFLCGVNRNGALDGKRLDLIKILAGVSKRF